MLADTKTEEGRRARNARRTRERIATAALRLFLKRGFDETTLDAIAEAADISRRTFFHYFASKEALLEAIDERVHDVFRRALAVTSVGQPPIGAVRAALQQMIECYASDDAIAMDRLMYSTEALRARKQTNYLRQEEALFAALCEKWPDAVRRSSLRMVAMIGIGAIRIASDRWREAPQDRPLARELDRAFDELRDEMGRGFAWT